AEAFDHERPERLMRDGGIDAATSGSRSTQTKALSMAAGIDARVFVMKRAAASAPAEWARMAYGVCTRLATTCARSAAWCSGLYAGGDTCSLSPWPRRPRSTQRTSRASLRGFEGGRLEILCPTFPRSTSRRLPLRRFLDECHQLAHFAS